MNINWLMGKGEKYLKFQENPSCRRQAALSAKINIFVLLQLDKSYD